MYLEGYMYPRLGAPDLEWLHLQPCLVPSWCGASRTVWDFSWPWGISIPWLADPANLPRI